MFPRLNGTIHWIQVRQIAKARDQELQFMTIGLNFKGGTNDLGQGISHVPLILFLIMIDEAERSSLAPKERVEHNCLSF